MSQDEPRQPQGTALISAAPTQSAPACPTSGEARQSLRDKAPALNVFQRVSMCFKVFQRVSRRFNVFQRVSMRQPYFHYFSWDVAQLAQVAQRPWQALKFGSTWR